MTHGNCGNFIQTVDTGILNRAKNTRVQETGTKPEVPKSGGERKVTKRHNLRISTYFSICKRFQEQDRGTKKQRGIRPP